MSKRKVSRKSRAPEAKDKGHQPQTGVLSEHRHGLKVLISLSLMVVTLFVFWPLGNHEFINLDDDVYVYANPQVKAGLTLKGVMWAFTSLEAGNWHPLTWLSHMLDCELYGLNPGAHHVTSLLYHIANTLLLFWVLRRMTGRLWPSSFVAALFALHPLHVESVAWVAERKDVLSTFFWMLTLWAYLRYVEQPGLTRYLLTILFFTLGLLSKPMLVTLPFVLLLLDYWPLGRFPLGEPSSEGNSSTRPSMNRKGQGWFTRRLVLEKIPFFSLVAVSSVITFVAQQGAGAVQSLEYSPLEARIGNALVSYIVYIGKMIWPHPLAVLYPHPGMLPMWQVAGAGLLLVCGSILVVRAIRKYPYLLVGWLWYLGTLVPVIGLVQVGSQGMADRYTYVPLIGLFIMTAMGVSDTLKKWRYRKIALIVSACLVLSFFITVARQQVCRWQTGTTLFEHTLAVTAKNFLIHNDLGFLLEKQGKIEEAVSHYTEALRIKSNYAEAYNNLGIALAHQGKVQEAVAYFAEALRIKPHYAEAHNNLGVALARQGKTQEAIAHYTEAVRINPNHTEAQNNLGVTLADQGKTQEAMAHYTEALQINPQSAAAHTNLGNALVRQGRTQEAIAHYTEALRIDPHHADAHYNLGNALARQGKTSEAIAHYTEVLRNKPADAEAHNNLGVILADQAKTQEAMAHYTEALRISPKYTEAHNNLGIALARQGKNEEALFHFVEALRINPNYAEAHNNLGNVLSLQGRTQEAIAHFIQALRINPDLAEAHFSLGMCYFKIGNQSAAMEEYKILKRINLDLANTLSQKISK